MQLTNLLQKLTHKEKPFSSNLKFRKLEKVEYVVDDIWKSSTHKETIKTEHTPIDQDPKHNRIDHTPIDQARKHKLKPHVGKYRVLMWPASYMTYTMVNMGPHRTPR
eukprot:c35332_g1_i1 orf=87-407(+)